MEEPRARRHGADPYAHPGRGRLRTRAVGWRLVAWAAVAGCVPGLARTWLPGVGCYPWRWTSDTRARSAWPAYLEPVVGVGHPGGPAVDSVHRGAGRPGSRCIWKWGIVADDLFRSH